jgi:Raf kinase inhibitor-like YbhB/YbcL family protein
MRMRHAAGVVAIAMLAAACAGSGGDASAPAGTTAIAASASPALVATAGPASSRPTVPARTPSTTPTPSVQPTPLPIFTLTSTAFAPRTGIPTRYTCDGADVSPPLAWSGAPAGTASLVLIVHDPDAGFLHWLAYEIPGAPSGSLPEAIPASARTPVQGRNGFGKIGYGGPCPPHGAAAHHYVFGIWAVSRDLGLGAGRTAAEVEAAMGGDILATTELVGLYKRQ